MLQITSNLEAALRAVRQRKISLPLWCDRVCINQKDLVERNHQVHLMRQIFVSTDFVNIWLGPDFSGAKDVFVTLHQLARGVTLPAILQSRPNNIAIDHVGDLTMMFEYPWWQRLWTIQEALLAKRALVQCEPHVIDLETIMQAFELLWNQLIQQSLLLQHICGADTVQSLRRQLEVTVRRLHVTRSLILSRLRGKVQIFRDDVSKWPMVMHTCAWSNATDPLDKFYGTLGLFPSLFLEVDYSLSLRQTYSRSTFAMIKCLWDLSVLTQTVSHISVDNGLPSWVPDWRHPHKETAPLLAFYSYFQAGRNLFLDAQLLDNEVFQISSHFLDDVVTMGEVYDDNGSDAIKELIPLLRPTIQTWLSLAGVPSPTRGSFLAYFTEESSESARVEHPPNDEIGRPHQPARKLPPRADGPASHAPQSNQAPVYEDMSYAAKPANRGTKRTAEDNTMYMPQQSQSAPMYRDAAYTNPYSPSAASGTSKTGPRSYDYFSHTYGHASSAMRPQAVDKRQVKDSGNAYFNGIPASEVFWRSLCMDLVEDAEIKNHRRCKTSDSWCVWEWLDWILGYGIPVATIPQMHWRLTTQLQGKRIVRTKKGYLGLVGRDTQVGDQIWILAGGAYPYMLRRQNVAGDDEMIRVVSTAYVHGFMDGEDIKGDDCSRIKLA